MKNQIKVRNNRIKEILDLIEENKSSQEKHTIREKLVQISKPKDFKVYFIYFKNDHLNVCFYNGIKLIQIKGNNTYSVKNLPYQIYIKRYDCSFMKYFDTDIYYETEIVSVKYSASQLFKIREMEIFNFDYFFVESNFEKSIIDQNLKDEIRKIKNQAKSIIERDKMIFNEQFETLKRDFDNKVDQLNDNFNSKIDFIINEYGKSNIGQKNREISELTNEIKIYKSLLEKKENNDKNLLKIKFLEKESLELKNELKRVSSLLKETKTKLENCQKFFHEYKNSNSTNSIEEIPINSQESISGLENDGSKGFHIIARENGRFGSLPSYDNYSDNYIEISKNGDDY